MLTLATRSSRPAPAAKASLRGDVHDAVNVKRARAPTSSDDGMRVLVDRLWPRGVPRARLIIDLWLKDVSPSAGLRQWYAHDSDRRDEFARKYRAELSAHEDLLYLLDDLRMRDRLTLLCDASDTALSHGIVLRDVLIEAHFLRHTFRGESHESQ